MRSGAGIPGGWGSASPPLSATERNTSLTINLQDLAQEDFCYLTTTGRVTGRPHTVEIWFAIHQQTLYILSGGRDRSDWVKNAMRQPHVTIKIQDTLFSAQARLIEDAEEDVLARRLLLEKYADYEDDLDDWGRTSLPVAFDLIPQ